MEKIVLEIPEEILISLKETPEEFSKDILMLAAVKLYQMGKLSSGRAAQLAGIPRVSFLQADNNIGGDEKNGKNRAIQTSDSRYYQGLSRR